MDALEVHRTVYGLLQASLLAGSREEAKSVAASVVGALDAADVAAVLEVAAVEFVWRNTSDAARSHALRRVTGLLAQVEQVLAAEAEAEALAKVVVPFERRKGQ